MIGGLGKVDVFDFESVVVFAGKARRGGGLVLMYRDVKISMDEVVKEERKKLEEQRFAACYMKIGMC